MPSPLSLIVTHEYLERVKRKSFIISTILVPLLMVLLMFAPAAIMKFSSPEAGQVAVLDQTGQIAPRLHSNGDIIFVVTTDALSTAREDENYDIIVAIGPDAVNSPQAEVSIYSHSALSMSTDSYITGQINRAIEDIRLSAYNMGDLRRIMQEVEVDCSYPTIRLDQGKESASSSTASYFLALILDMMLYMFILLYGQMVMNSIIEEKSNRVLELVVSSVKPETLMLGKIMGVGLVGITQILIWGVIVAACSAFVVPLFAEMAASSNDPELIAAISQISDPGYFLSLFAFMLLFFIGGYLFYASIYAAIASAVDNIQDAGQLSSVATIPVIVAIMASISVLSSPNSTPALWCSIIPFTSPMTMMARLPFGVPLWQHVVSLAVLYVSFALMIKLCAKIYRIGIFMYGKKPTLAEILRWARYK